MELLLERPIVDADVEHIWYLNYYINLGVGNHFVTVHDNPYIDTFQSKNGNKFFDFKLPFHVPFEIYQQGEQFPYHYYEASIMDCDIDQVLSYEIGWEIPVLVYLQGNRRRARVDFTYEY